jgi:hypothetical protein
MPVAAVAGTERRGAKTADRNMESRKMKCRKGTLTGSDYR